MGPSAPYGDAFRERMSELGYVEGKTIQSEYLDAGGSGAKLDAIMEGLVRDKVDIIVAMCTPEALSAKKFTTTIPDHHGGHRRSGEGRTRPRAWRTRAAISPAFRR